MADHRAIAAVSTALAGLLRARHPREEPGADGLEVALYQARDFESPMAYGFSVFLYRVAVGGTARSMPSLRGAGGQPRRPPLPLDLHYLVTPWAQDAARQQRMLGWAMRMLEDVAVLDAGTLNRYLPDTGAFAPHERVELTFDPLQLDDCLALWDRVLPTLPTSASYAVRMVQLDPYPAAEA